MSLNNIVLMGRFCAHPEARRASTGAAVTSFTLACERDFKAKAGTKETDFIDCVAWNNTADFIAKYFTKGSQAVVSGRLQMRSYTDKEGKKRKAAEVIVSNIYFADTKRSDASTNDEYAPAPAFAELSDDNEELPF